MVSSSMSSHEVGLQLLEHGLQLPEHGLQLPEHGLQLPELGLQLLELGLQLPEIGLQLSELGLQLHGLELRLHELGLQLFEPADSPTFSDRGGVDRESFDASFSGTRLQEIEGLEIWSARRGAGRTPRILPHLASSTVSKILSAPHPLDAGRGLERDGQTWSGLGVWGEFSFVEHVWDKRRADYTSVSEENKTGTEIF